GDGRSEVAALTAGPPTIERSLDHELLISMHVVERQKRDRERDHADAENDASDVAQSTHLIRSADSACAPRKAASSAEILPPPVQIWEAGPADYRCETSSGQRRRVLTSHKRVSVSEIGRTYRASSESTPRRSDGSPETPSATMPLPAQGRRNSV